MGTSFDRKVFTIILIFSVLSLLVSIVIAVNKINSNSILEGFCTKLSNGQCDRVQNSIYSSILGVDLTYFGIFTFLALSTLSFLQLRKDNAVRRKIVLYACIGAGIFALWLLIIQMIVLKAYCIFCLVIDTSSLILLITSIVALVRKS